MTFHDYLILVHPAKTAGKLLIPARTIQSLCQKAFNQTILFTFCMSLKSNKIGEAKIFILYRIYIFGRFCNCFQAVNCSIAAISSTFRQLIVSHHLVDRLSNHNGIDRVTQCADLTYASFQHFSNKISQNMSVPKPNNNARICFSAPRVSSRFAPTSRAAL